jgi:hypothetical protein
MAEAINNYRTLNYRTLQDTPIINVSDNKFIIAQTRVT